MRALKSVLFPTLGRPTIPSFIINLECYADNQIPIAPNKTTIYALCEYIIETIRFYDLPTMKIKSQADIKAMEIMKGGE